MKSLAALIVLNIVLTTGCQLAHSFNKTAKFTVTVVDDNGKSLEGVNVGVGFGRNFQSNDSVGKQAKTASDGKVTFSETTSGHITYGAKKDGYYNSHYVYDFSTPDTFRWEPWNPELKIVLRKIEDPVPMYARRAKIEIPVAGKDIGFDLAEHDWVVPYGKGILKDLIFNLKKESNGKRDFEYRVSIRFANKYDGLIQFEEDLHYGSQLKLPKVAPLEGYFDNKDIYVKRGLNVAESSSKRNMNYFFRIRSEEQDGHFKSGLYGKIIGDFYIGTKSKGTANIEFIYYLNPDGTRNLEFDPKRNLFDNLSDLEQVTEP